MLREIIESCLKEKKHEKLLDENTDYQKFFQKKLKKYGVKSPSELDDSKRKKFFDEVDKDWTGDDEDD